MACSEDVTFKLMMDVQNLPEVHLRLSWEGSCAQGWMMGHTAGILSGKTVVGDTMAYQQAAEALPWSPLSPRVLIGLDSERKREAVVQLSVGGVLAVHKALFHPSKAQKYKKVAGEMAQWGVTYGPRNLGWNIRISSVQG